jgi:hypothetical protein
LSSESLPFHVSSISERLTGETEQPGSDGTEIPSHDRHGARRYKLWGILFLAAYGMCLFVLIAHHEVSRDEVRAYSIARAAADPVDLVRNRLVNEGHPPLWYLTLWLGSRAWDNYAVLKTASLIAGLGVASVVFLASPFPLIHRCLFLLGSFPLYHFSLFCRGYGLAALLILLLAVEYSRAPMGSPWRVGGYNALLANTTVYGAIVACAFLLIPLGKKPKAGFSRRSYLGVITLLTAVGLALSLYTVWPTHDNLMMAGKGMQILRTGYANFAGEGIRSLYAVLTDQQGWIGYILMAYDVKSKLSQMGYGSLGMVVGIVGLPAILALFIRWPSVLIAFGLCFVVAGLFSMLVYPAYSYHIAIIGTFLFALLWIAWSRYYRAGSVYWRFVTYLLGFCLLFHAWDGVKAVWGDLHTPFSSKVAGAYLKQAYPNAVVICEPDVYGENLPYYTANSIYVVRERAFGKWVHLEKRFNRTMTLGEMMDASTQIQKASGKTVLVSLPKPIEEFQPGSFHGALGRTLEINKKELWRFRSEFHKVASFTEGSQTYVFYKDGNVP